MRASIFIDGGYLDKHVLSLTKERTDYRKIINNICGEGTQIVNIYYYHCLPYSDKNSSQVEIEKSKSRYRFYDALSHQGFKIRLGKVVRNYTIDGRPTYTQKQVDVMLAVDLLLEATSGKVDRVVLLTGDGDLIPAVKAAQMFVPVKLVHGKFTNSSNAKTSFDLYQEALYHQELTQEDLA